MNHKTFGNMIHPNVLVLSDLSDHLDLVSKNSSKNFPLMSLQHRTSDVKSHLLGQYQTLNSKL